MTTEELKTLLEIERKKYAILKTKHTEMEADLKTAIGAIRETTTDLGIDLSKKSAIIMALPSLATKLMTGNLKLDKIEPLAPMIEKYKYLIEQ